MDFNLLEKKGVDIARLYRKIYVMYLLIDCAESIDISIVSEIKSKTKIFAHNDDAYELQLIYKYSKKVIRSLDETLKTSASSSAGEKFGVIADKFHEELDDWFKEKFKEWVYSKFKIKSNLEGVEDSNKI